MDNNNIIEIINEEIANFDFLGNDKYLKEKEIVDSLTNEELQKQFICDSLLNKNDKVKIIKIIDSSITGNWDEPNTEDANRISIEYSLEMAYIYDSMKEPLSFNLFFNSDNINISVNGWYNAGDGYTSPPEGDSWYDGFDWNDINVSLFTMDGDEIDFIAFKNAPLKIQVLFIRHYLENFIENETLEIKTPEMKDSIQNTPYC